MKQTGLFRSITKVRANCEQSGKTGADGAQRKTMSTVTYILLGKEEEVGQQARGNASLSTRGVCMLLSGPWARASLRAECHACRLHRADLNT